MIFGFSGALIAGFILTACANWTNSEPYQGLPLIILSVFWGLERVSYFLPLNVHLQFVLMNLFFPMLFIMLFIKLRKFPKQRNVFIPIILTITVAKLLHSMGNIYSIDYLESSGKEISIGIIRLIVLLIAGRVIPFFSRKKIEGIDIKIPNWLNPFALIPIVLLAFPWPESTPKILLASLYLIAITGNVTRQFLWKPLKTIKVPILFILHIGIAFINISLFLEYLGLFYSQINFTQAPLHLLLAGGLGTIGIGIMTRVSLGHTGRDIKADQWTKLIYLLIVVGSLIRVFVPVLFPAYYFNTLHVASILWSSGFLIFLLKYTNILVNPRPDGKTY
jgi:uncharacterized protein involved in response to NO